MARPRAGLIEEDRPTVGGDDAAARPIRDVFRDDDLALIRLDGRELRQQVAREGIGRDDDAAPDDGSAIGDNSMPIRLLRDDAAHLGPRLERDSVA